MYEEADVNIKLSNYLYTFTRQSLLKKYLKKKGLNRKGSFTIKTILLDIRQILMNEKLFDETNPSIVMCNSELEDVFDMKALHVTQIRYVIQKHIKMKKKVKQRSVVNENENQYQNVVRKCNKIYCKEEGLNCCLSEYSKEEIEKKRKEMQQHYLIDVDLLHVLNPGNLDTRHFTFYDIFALLSKYLISKRNQIFDRRNILVAIIKDDPLQSVFNVNAFSRSQVMQILKKK